MYDSSTMLALLFAVARIEGWADGEWIAQRDRAIVEFLSPERAEATDRGPAVLTGEIDRWERRLAAGAAPEA